MKKDAQNRQMKQLRDAKVALIEKTINECNELIATENMLVAELEELATNTAAVEVQLETVKSSSADCADTIALYGIFKEQNQKYIEILNDEYAAQWDAFESRCFEWNAHQLTVWMRRITMSIVVDEQDWMAECRNVEEQSSVFILNLVPNFLLYRLDIDGITQRLSRIHYGNQRNRN